MAGFFSVVPCLWYLVSPCLRWVCCFLVLLALHHLAQNPFGRLGKGSFIAGGRQCYYMFPRGSCLSCSWWGHRDANREWEKVGVVHLSLHLPHPAYPAPCQQSTVHFLRKKMWLRDLPSAPLYFFCSFAFQWLQPLLYNPSCTLTLPSKRFAQQPKEGDRLVPCLCCAEAKMRHHGLQATATARLNLLWSKGRAVSEGFSTTALV